MYWPLKPQSLGRWGIDIIFLNIIRQPASDRRKTFIKLTIKIKSEANTYKYMQRKLHRFGRFHSFASFRSGRSVLVVSVVSLSNFVSTFRILLLAMSPASLERITKCIHTYIYIHSILF